MTTRKKPKPADSTKRVAPFLKSRFSDRIDDGTAQRDVLRRLEADGSVTEARIADGSVTTAKLAADSVNGSKIADSSIDTVHLADDSIDSQHYVDGSIDTVHLADEAWSSYTPTLTGISTGNGTLDADYIRLGSTVFVRVIWTMGTTSSVSSEPRFTLPDGDSLHGDYTPVSVLGHAVCADSNGFIYNGFVTEVSGDTSKVRAMLQAANGTYVTQSGGTITSTSPFTWTNPDRIELYFHYEAA